MTFYYYFSSLETDPILSVYPKGYFFPADSLATVKYLRYVEELLLRNSAGSSAETAHTRSAWRTAESPSWRATCPQLSVMAAEDSEVHLGQWRDLY